MIKHPKSTQMFIEWQTSVRWKNIKRPYGPEDVFRLRSKVEIEYSLARKGAEKLWNKLMTQPYVGALGALKQCIVTKRAN
jgi:isocitrate lyase